jgi:acetyltransferase-like isoleucine patch superfamily enzyme
MEERLIIYIKQFFVIILFNLRRIRLFSFKNRNRIKTFKVSIKTELEGKNFIDKNVNIENSIVGFGSYIGKNSSLARSKIGRFCSIANEVKVVNGFHPTKKIVSTSPYFFKSSPLIRVGKSYSKSNTYQSFRYAGNEKYFVIIGNDVWIAHNVTILSGVKIGDGAIIGASTVVTKDVPPYAIVVGNPSKIIRYRFTEEQIRILLKIQWWNFPQQDMFLYSEYWLDIQNFINKFGKK